MKALLYDWHGLNVTLFRAINQATPDGLATLASLGNTVGDYWGGPVLLALLLGWAIRQDRAGKSTDATQFRLVARRFVFGFSLACVSVALLKLGLDFPRPLALLGAEVRLIGSAELRYSLPSGHVAYAALITVVLWPLVPRRLRLLPVVFVAWIAWARSAAGAHFPADVLAGAVLGTLCGAAAWRTVISLPPVCDARQRALFDHALREAKQGVVARGHDRARQHLETAHVLGQHWFWPHLRAHVWMLRLGLLQRDGREVCGQLLRIALTPLEHLTGRLPLGNTGGANVSAFRSMPDSQQRIVERFNAR